MDTFEPNPRADLGANNPPPPTMAERLAEHFSALAVVNRHPEVFEQIGHLTARSAGLPVESATPEHEVALTAFVKDCRAVAGSLDARKTLEKAPLLSATRVLDAMVKTEGDRIDKMKRGAEATLQRAAQKRAQEQAQLRADLAAKAAAEAAVNAEAAASLEAAGHTTAAGLVYDQAMRSEREAGIHDARANGPVADLARAANVAGTVSLRTELVFEVTDADALRATLGPLGRCFTLQAVEAAIRQYIAEHKRTQAKGSLPVLAGVTFKFDEKANIR